MKMAVFAAAILTIYGAYAEETVIRTIPPFEQHLNAPFRLFPTQNNFTFIAVNTVVGKVYQVHYGVGEFIPGIIPINEESLVRDDSDAHAGRFTLYETVNMFNFILVDQYAGAFWQVQWSIDDENARLIKRIPLIKNN